MVPAKRGCPARGAAPMLRAHICLMLLIQSEEGSAPEGLWAVPGHLKVANPHPVNLPKGGFASQPVGRRGRGV